MAETGVRKILHASAKDGKFIKQWIVGVFANERLLKPHVALVKLAYRSGDDVMVKAADPNAPRAEDGSLLKDIKFSVSTAPYNPTFDVDEEPEPPAQS